MVSARKYVFKGIYYFDVYLVFLFLFLYLRCYLEDGEQFACLDTYKIVIHVVATFIAFYRKKFQSEDTHN